jgi:DNA-binding PadR family transcriptional regulator
MQHVVESVMVLTHHVLNIPSSGESCIATGSDISLIHRYRRVVASNRKESLMNRRFEGPGGPTRRDKFGPFGPGFGPPPFGGSGHRGRGRGRGTGRRTRRGNVRAAILGLLNERPMHGYEMIQELENRTGGVWRPSPGSVYPTLQMLEDEDLVTSEEQSGKKLFTLTDAGRTEAARQTVAPWDEVTAEAGESATHARDTLGQLIMALRQVLAAGTEEQQAQALEIITDARRKLYGILAEDGSAE